MRIFVDPNYLKQRSQFDLRACCEDCVHFDDAASECSLTYPTHDHRHSTHAALQDGDPMLFCKTFEIA